MYFIVTIKFSSVLDISGLHEFIDYVFNYITKSTLCVVAAYIH
jgi:hypothetical protein